MKYLILFSFLIHFSCANAQEKFDIITYASPNGWAKSSTSDTMTFSKEDPNGNFCLITLYRSIDAGNDSKSNFDLSWASLVQEQLGTGKAEMQPPSTDDGWETQVGSASFEKEGLQGAAILLTSTQNSRIVNILILMNSDAFQSEMETFLNSLDIAQTNSSNVNSNSNSVKNPSKSTKEKPELWANMRYVPKNYYDVTAGAQPISDYYVVYPNGDYLPNAPFEGLNNLNKSINAESWGKFTINGSKGRFKNKYDDIPVTKKSETYMEKDGYTHGFHKCLPVDGAKLEGFYTHVAPNWGKDSKLDYLDDAGCQFTIQFNKDGTFIDNGIFSTSTYNCVSGKGIYSIENFTITFQYDDGRVVQRLFTAPPARNISSYDETLYLGQTPYYKKM